MNVNELKAKVDAYRTDLKTKTGICHFSPTGPVGISLIDALVAAIEEQHRRIEKLERLINN